MILGAACALVLVIITVVHMYKVRKREKFHDFDSSIE